MSQSSNLISRKSIVLDANKNRSPPAHHFIVFRSCLCFSYVQDPVSSRVETNATLYIPLYIQANIDTPNSSSRSRAPPTAWVRASKTMAYAQLKKSQRQKCYDTYAQKRKTHKRLANDEYPNFARHPQKREVHQNVILISCSFPNSGSSTSAVDDQGL